MKQNFCFGRFLNITNLVVQQVENYLFIEEYQFNEHMQTKGLKYEVAEIQHKSEALEKKYKF